MAICPFAVNKLLPESSTQGHIEPRLLILHSAAGHGSLYRYFRDNSNLESHFWVGLDGTIEQYMDTNVRADANLDANGYAISVETENSLEAVRSQRWDTDPWTDEQLASLTRLANWVSDTHPAVSRRLTPQANASGLAWHVQFGAPGPWTHHAKVCPGKARIAQVENVVLPRFVADIVTKPIVVPPKPVEIDVTAAECQQIVDTALRRFAHELDVRLDTIYNNTNSLEHSFEQVKAVLKIK